MIGLEFLINMYGFKNNDIAKILKISPVTLHDWLFNKRKIPNARIKELSNIFKNIPEEYFQMDADIIKDIYVEALNKAIDNIDEPYKQSLVQLKIILERRI